MFEFHKLPVCLWLIGDGEHNVLNNSVKMETERIFFYNKLKISDLMQIKSL